jgi:hypothetical protein
MICYDSFRAVMSTFNRCSLKRLELENPVTATMTTRVQVVVFRWEVKGVWFNGFNKRFDWIAFDIDKCLS